MFLFTVYRYPLSQDFITGIPETLKDPLFMNGQLEWRLVHGVRGVPIFDHFLARDFHPKVLILEPSEGLKILGAIKYRMFLIENILTQIWEAWQLPPCPQGSVGSESNISFAPGRQSNDREKFCSCILWAYCPNRGSFMCPDQIYFFCTIYDRKNNPPLFFIFAFYHPSLSFLRVSLLAY